MVGGASESGFEFQLWNSRPLTLGTLGTLVSSLIVPPTSSSAPHFVILLSKSQFEDKKKCVFEVLKSLLVHSYHPVPMEEVGGNLALKSSIKSPQF